MAKDKQVAEKGAAMTPPTDIGKAAEALEALQARVRQLEQENARLHETNSMFAYPPEHRVSVAESERDVLRAKLEALEAHKAAAPLCEKHAPNGGARSGCLVCSGMRLSGALSEIDYICGEPNEYEFSQYDADFDEARVVGRVKALRAKEQP